jgi:phage antirepressor YoqD-like protein
MNNDKNLVKGIEFKFVRFNNMDLLAVKGSDGKIYTSIKKISEDLGLAYASQLNKIKGNPVYEQAISLISIPSNSGVQTTSCINIDFLPLWLAGIHINKVSETIKPYLLEFQLKARDILAKAFINPEITPVQPQNQRIPQSFSEALLLAGRLAQEIEEKEKRLQLSEPKAVLFDVFTNTTEFKTVRQIGYKLKPYGLGPNKIFEFLREEKVLTRVNGENYPTHSYTDYFLINTVVKNWIDKKTGEQKSIAKDMLKVVPRFYLLLAKLLIKRNVLTLQDFNKIDFSNVPEDHLISNKIFN